MIYTSRDLSTLRVDTSKAVVIDHGSLPTPPARPAPVGKGADGWLTDNVDGQSKCSVSNAQFSKLLPRPWETPDAR